MATIAINFTANTTGEHTVYWRNYQDPANTYPNSLSVTVTVPGPQSVDIPINENLYCTMFDVIYQGYVIADCMDATPVTNGVPDSVTNAGSTFTVTAEQQQDPCEFVGLKCESVGILEVAVTSGGSGYAGTETLVIDPPDLAGGVQATGTITFSGNAISAVTITNPGSGYTSTPSVNSTAPSEGTYAQFSVTMEDCAVVDLTSTACNSTNNVSETPDYVLALGDQINYCIDRTSFNDLLAARPELGEVDIMPNFGGTGTGKEGCHCLECQKISVLILGTGSGKLTYQTCGDTSQGIVMVTIAITGGNSYELGCILHPTIHVDEGTLTNSPQITNIDCNAYY